jgi:hypothetical protein
LSAAQPKPIVFFLDRTHGKAIRDWLKAVRIRFELHEHYFDPEDADPLWIKRCAKEEWIILSGDKRIEVVPENRQAAIDGKCKVFLFDDTNSKTEEWAGAILVGRQRIFEIIERNDGPFFVTINKFAKSHISRPRYCAGGGPKPIPELIVQVQPKPADNPEPPKKKQQAVFEWPD